MNENQQDRARAILGSMPYGGLAHFRTLDKEITVDALLDDLERLRDVLRDCAVRNGDRDEELLAIRRELDGAGALLARLLPKGPTASS